MPGPVRNPAEAFQQLEAIMLRQMLQSSGAFRAGSTPGAQLRTDMFVETLADAVAKAGGLGIAKMLEHQLGGGTPAPTPPTPESDPSGLGRRPVSTGMPFQAAGTPAAAAGSVAPGARGARNGVDDLDDPNSEAALPEDPSADSIDDYQVGGRAAGGLDAASAGTGGAALAARARDAAPTSPFIQAHAITSEVTSVITSGYGERVHPITGDLRFHTGIDLRAAPGAPIRAAAGGVVVEAGRRGGYGNTVEIDHGHGTTTLYAHASALLVARGQHVAPGQPVALVGQTGQATGPHLHFEVRRNDHPVNPTAANVPISIARALNRYRERAEATDAGTPSSARGGGKQ